MRRFCRLLLVICGVYAMGYELAAVDAFGAAFNSASAGNLVLIAGLLGLITTWRAGRQTRTSISRSTRHKLLVEVEQSAN